VAEDKTKKREDIKADLSIEAALVAINYLSKCSQAIKAKRLLPGNQFLREMTSNMVDKPLFVVNDLFGKILFDLLGGGGHCQVRTTRSLSLSVRHFMLFYHIV